jgi:hypothetical protein
MNAALALRLDRVFGAAVCHGPVPPFEVERAEQQLGVRFPVSYRAYLLTYGASFGNCIDVAGLPLSDRASDQPPQWSDVVAINLRARRPPAPLPTQYIEFSDDGSECRYLLDVERMDSSGEAPVVAMEPGRDYVVVAASFIEFVERVLQGEHP